MVAFRNTMFRAAGKYLGIGIAAFVFALSPVRSTAVAVPDIEQWGIYEVSLRGPTNGNPFLDVQFSARFSLGDTNIDVDGFYDGGIYRVRFMPGMQGA
jgi:hypothetical protein